MHAIRHGIAILLVVAIPGAILYWFLIHPFINLWRRLGIIRSYVVICTVLAFVMTVLYLLHDRLLAMAWPFIPWLALVGAALLAIALWLKILLSRELSARVLIGIPEIANEQPGHLLVEGLFARVRHPRYLQMTIALTGFALIANYPAVYGALLIWAAGIHAVALLEERELCRRFGDRYRQYCMKVPRYFPHLRQKQHTTTRH